MIRRVIAPLVSSDAMAIDALGSEFAAEAGVPFDTEWAMAQIAGILQSGIGGLWFLETDDKVVGMIAGVIVPSLYDGSVEISELFWFVSKDYRTGMEPIRLFKQLEIWGRELRAKRVRFMHLEKLQPEKISDFYERFGFKLIEKVYIKELE